MASEDRRRCIQGLNRQTHLRQHTQPQHSRSVAAGSAACESVVMARDRRTEPKAIPNQMCSVLSSSQYLYFQMCLGVQPLQTALVTAMHRKLVAAQHPIEHCCRRSAGERARAAA